MQTIIVSAYVTAYDNAQAHVRSGAPLRISVRIPQDDIALLDIPTDLQLEVVSRLSTEIMPRSLAFDVSEEGAVTVRLPKSSELNRNRSMSSMAEAAALHRQLFTRCTVRRSQPAFVRAFREEALAA